MLEDNTSNTFTPIACMEHARRGITAEQCDLMHRAERSYRRALIEHPTPRRAGQIADEILERLRRHSTRVAIIDADSNPLTVLDSGSTLFEQALRSGQIHPTGNDLIFQMS